MVDVVNNAPLQRGLVEVVSNQPAAVVADPSVLAMTTSVYGAIGVSHTEQTTFDSHSHQ